MDEDKYKDIHLGFNNPVVWGVEIDSQSYGGCSLAFTTQDPMEDEAWRLLNPVIRKSRPLAEDRYENIHLGFWTDDETIHAWKLTHNPIEDVT